MPGKVITTNAGNLALRFRRRREALPGEVDRALRDTLTSAKAAAIGFSSAKAYRPKRDKTHPYARRAPHPPLPPFLVNVQSGRFRSSWKTRLSKSGKGYRATLYNTAPYSGSFNGEPTRTMIARPILAHVIETIGPQRRKRMQSAVRRAMSKR